MSLKPYKVIATVEYTQEIEAENLLEALDIGRGLGDSMLANGGYTNSMFDEWEVEHINIDAGELIPRANDKNT